MSNEYYKVGTEEDPEGPEVHEDLLSAESTENLGQQIVSKSTIETNDFKQTCMENIESIKSMADKNGLTVDNEGINALRGLAEEAEIAKNELIKEIGNEKQNRRVEISSLINSRGQIGTQGFTREGVENILQHITNESFSDRSSLKEIIDGIKSSSMTMEKIKDFLENHPIDIITLPDGIVSIKDGHHRAFIAQQIGMTSLPFGTKEENKEDSSEIIKADSEAREKYEKSWPYQDYSYEDWRDNGFLVTKEGIPSKLDRECYKLVRTKKFKEWFGDWEEKAKNASKMIDLTTGEPQIFYRGDKSLYKDGFLVKPEEERTVNSSEANPMKRRNIAQSRNQGIFFTDNKNVALEYGTDLSAVTLGKYGLHPEQDHPKSFSKIRNWLESFANKDPYFWKKTLDRHILGRYQETTDFAYKRNFDNFVRRIQLEEKDALNLWEELKNNKRLNPPGYYLDLFIKKGLFEDLIKGFESQSFRGSDAPFGKPWFYKFGSENTPGWSKQFKQLALEYFSEPLALSTVFVRSTNPKRMKWVNVDDGYEIYNSRIDGHDAFIHEKGVGKHTKGVQDGADEIVVFQPENIWTVKKEPLADKTLSQLK